MKYTFLTISIIFLTIVNCGKKMNGQTIVDEIAVLESLGNNTDTANTDTDSVHYLANRQNGMKDESTSSGTDYDDYWDGVTCKGYHENDGDIQIQECIFPNAKLQQVYDIVKGVDDNLRAELPLENIEYIPAQEGFSSVRYEYMSEKYLFIKIHHVGGGTYVEIIENDDNTISKITFFHA